tara:strand:+ start:754 stop:912 length:159 start_codon:yes stop_codon:yes gene_type:complete
VVVPSPSGRDSTRHEQTHGLSGFVNSHTYDTTQSDHINLTNRTNRTNRINRI